MGSVGGVAERRRVLVDALTLCLERSKVCAVVDAQTLRSVLASGAGELWREGELRLDYVWKLLCQQPGLSAQDVAPPMFAFKAYEEELGVPVRLPQALSAVPRGEQVRLREQLGLTREDFARALAGLKAGAPAETSERSPETTAAESPAKPAAQSKAKGRAPVERRGLVLGLAAVSVLSLALGLYVALHDATAAYDLADVASIVPLTDGKREGLSMSARLADPVRWNALSRDDKEKVARQLLEVEAQKGIRAITLTDGNAIRAQLAELGGSTLVNVR